MKIIFSDLDGTLLNHDSYSYSKAKDALILIKKKKIPLIFCTSKTRAEIEFWRKKIGNNEPFISENGGGIFIPRNYFPFTYLYSKKEKEYYVIEFGSHIQRLESVLNKMKKNYLIKSFSDMTIDEIASDANVDRDIAFLSKQREYDIPFKLLDINQKDDVLNEIKRLNLSYTRGGRYFHLIGNHSKGDAIETLTYLYDKHFDTVETVGIGDSENDFSMLDTVEKPYLVQRGDGSYASEKYIQADGAGPEGWKKIIYSELKE
ncbi:MAG: HAD-IIB family hydrolase [Candidatus Thermoplasmatota archaeon]|nr:HAD-IIB family hydrolase [Candidatus Thermoplasmatota archaeon]